MPKQKCTEILTNKVAYKYETKNYIRNKKSIIFNRKFWNLISRKKSSKLRDQNPIWNIWKRFLSWDYGWDVSEYLFRRIDWEALLLTIGLCRSFARLADKSWTIVWKECLPDSVFKQMLKIVDYSLPKLYHRRNFKIKLQLLNFSHFQSI